MGVVVAIFDFLDFWKYKEVDLFIRVGVTTILEDLDFDRRKEKEFEKLGGRSKVKSYLIFESSGQSLKNEPLK